MSDLIKFDLIKPDDRKVKKAKQSSRLLFMSILVTLLLVTIVVSVFIYIQKDEEGLAEEKAEPITEEQLKKDSQAQTQPVKVFKYEKPETKIKNETVDKNIKTVSNMILKRRLGWYESLKDIKKIDLPLLSFASYEDFGIFVNARLDSGIIVDSVLADIEKDSLDFKKQTSTDDEILFLTKMPKREDTEDIKTLEIVQPFFFAKLSQEIETLAGDKGLYVKENAPIGNIDYGWGKKYRFTLHIKGKYDDIATFLKEVDKRKEMVDIESISFENKDLDKDKLSESEFYGSITFALYKVIGIVE